VPVPCRVVAARTRGQCGLRIGEEQVRGVLAAVAPIVGTPRVVAATGNIVQALGFALEMAELAEEADS
jgi:hypothetical protein